MKYPFFQRLFAVALMTLCFCTVQPAFAQQGVLISGSPSGLPDNSAMLDVSSTSKGVLIPRMTASQRTGISSPATGLMVYQTDGSSGFYYYNGSAWIQVGSVAYSGGGGTVNYVPKWSAANTLAGTSLLYDNGTSVGINTTSPGASYKLDVAGDVHSSGIYTVGTRGSHFGSDQGGHIELGANNTTANAANAVPYIDFHFGTGSAQDFNTRLTNDANGVLSLIGQLKITGGSPGAGKVLTSDATGLASWTTPLSGSGTATRVAFWSGSNTLSSNGNLYWDNTNGRLGVGISAPTGRLDVQGTTARTGTHGASPSFYVSGTLTTGQTGPASGNIEFRHNNGTQGIGFGYNTIYQTGSNTDQDLNLLSRGSSPLTLNAYPYSTGNVMIGTTAAATNITKLNIGNGGWSSIRSDFNQTFTGIPAFMTDASDAALFTSTTVNGTLNGQSVGSEHRLYIEDDGNDAFSIWGNSCGGTCFNVGTSQYNTRFFGNGTVQMRSLAGTGNRVVYADANGVLNVSSTNVLTSSTPGTSTVSAGANKIVIPAGSAMNVSVGDKIVIEASVTLRLTGGSNTDDFFIRPVKSGTSTCVFSNGTSAPRSMQYRPDEGGSDHDNYRPTFYLDYCTVTGAGTFILRLDVQNTGDDTWEHSQAVMVARKW